MLVSPPHSIDHPYMRSINSHRILGSRQRSLTAAADLRSLLLPSTCFSWSSSPLTAFIDVPFPSAPTLSSSHNVRTHMIQSDPMYQNQMTYNGPPPPFFPPGILFHSAADESHHFSPIPPSTVPCANPAEDFTGGAAPASAMLGKRSVWSEEMTGGEEELSDDCSLPGEKKRRLSMEQVRTLERSFELGNKLEPERKMQLARALGLQPRQIAIWFQNRRARWKTKQLEKDYDTLKREFEIVRSQNDSLHAHNKNLQAELLALKGREGAELINLNKETEGSSSNRSENCSDINLDISRTAAIDVPMSPNQSSRQFFPCYRPAPNVTQVPKIENGSSAGGNDENFSNIFCGVVDEQPAFWPWSEH